MQLPRQSPPVERRVSRAAMLSKGLAASGDPVACAICNAACEALPFPANVICHAACAKTVC